jgi:uncharacterized protein (DUF1015 family)
LPVIRPFRALRYAPDLAPSLGRLVAPPYDVIGAEERTALLAAHQYNVVRLDLPIAEPGDTSVDDRYQRAAAFLAAWRAAGILRRDPRDALYVYEQQFVRPGRAATEARRGFFARVGLEPFGTGIRAHERTLAGPREDRYRLLQATNVNTSPVVAMYADAGGGAAAAMDVVTAGPADFDLVDRAGERHRLWVVPAGTDPADALGRAAAAGPLTIADGHHRYETALRHAMERRAADPASTSERDDGDVLMLLLEPIAGPVVVLPTHRLVRGLDADAARNLQESLGDLFDVEPGVSREALLRQFGPAARMPGGEGRFGLWTRGRGAILRARRDAFEPILPEGGAAVRRLDVTLLGAALEALVGLDARAIVDGSRLGYTKDAAEAIVQADHGPDGTAAAFLLDPTPASEILAVAAEGDVMPQKSTYIYPKAATGLVINPLEG